MNFVLKNKASSIILYLSNENIHLSIFGSTILLKRILSPLILIYEFPYVAGINIFVVTTGSTKKSNKFLDAA